MIKTETISVTDFRKQLSDAQFDVPNREYIICKQAAYSMRMDYPDVLFHFDLAGLKLTKAQAGMTKAIQCGRGWCDLQLAEPRGIYHGYFVEIKREGTNLLKKNGTWASDHIQEQENMIQKLRRRGYKAEFAIGLDQLLTQIKYYMSLPKWVNP